MGKSLTTIYCIIVIIFAVLCCSGKEEYKDSQEIPPASDTVSKPVKPPTVALKLPRENETFDLWTVSAIIFQWNVSVSVPGGCKVLISPSAGMTSAVAFSPPAEQSSAFAVTPTALDDILEDWNIAHGVETTVYWTVAANDASQSLNVNSQPRALKLKRTPATQVVRVMSYNIHNALGVDNNVVDYQRVANIIINTAPDAVALQEVDSVTTRSKGVDVLLRLAELTSMVPTYSPAIVIYNGKYGDGILSKQQPLSCKRVQLPGSDELRSLLIMEFKDYVFCCTHFSLIEVDRNTCVGLINQAVNDFNKPVILAGDLNDAPDSPVMNAFKQKWAILSDVSQFTFPANAPEVTIDYILGYTGKGYKYPVVQTQVLNQLASDHRPLFADIRIVIND